MAPKYSTIRSDKIEYSFWLIFDRYGGLRMSRGEPGVTADERAMACSAVLPRSLFSTPTLRASISVADPAPNAFNIDVQAAGDALKLALGVDIDLQIREIGQPKENDQ